MQMRRSVSRIPRITDIAEDAAGIHDVALLERAVAIEVRIVVHLPAGPENIDDESSECVGSHADDDAFGGAQYRSSAGREDVHALV